MPIRPKPIGLVERGLVENILLLCVFEMGCRRWSFGRRNEDDDNDDDYDDLPSKMEITRLYNKY